MHGLSNFEFLALWERGRQLPALDRSLLALHVACAEDSSESLADWPLGRRNRALVELRNACFGPALQAWSTCPQCGEKVELRIDSNVFTRKQEGAPANSPETVEVNGETFRLPTTRDLARVSRETSGDQDPALAALGLLRACKVQRNEQQREGWSEEEIRADHRKDGGGGPAR